MKKNCQATIQWPALLATLCNTVFLTHQNLVLELMDCSVDAIPCQYSIWRGALHFFWDGRAPTLEEQVLMPVQDPLEMHETWSNAISELQVMPVYQQMFEDAFGSPGVDSVRASKALAQFVRTIVSGDSPFDRYLNTGDISHLGPDWEDVLFGYSIFKNFNQGDCIHCHTDPFSSRLVTDYSFRNNGLDAVQIDTGHGGGTFKVPSLRNLVFTAPYMHDGRFETIDEVLDFYINDVTASPTIDPVMYQSDTGTGTLGAPLSPIQKSQLKKFLLSLTDSSYIINPDYKNPN